MQSLAEAIKEMNAEKKKTPRSERAELLNELYEGYLRCNKKSNLSAYKKWLGDKWKNNTDTIQMFKQTKLYFKPISVRYFCVKLGHIKTKDLYYLVSVLKDKETRGENFNSWLFYNLKYQPDTDLEK